MNVTMIHNPRCSKSRASLQLLQDNGIEPDLVLYLDNPLTEQQLAEIVAKLGIAPKELIRFGEGTARELGLSPLDQRNDMEWLALMANHPILIERPIVIRDDRAIVGRPPEKVLRLLD
jgi:arsenate reductase